jgi:hypothetical protein
MNDLKFTRPGYVVLFVAALVLVMGDGLQIYHHFQSPFWVDEAFTAGLACQPSLAQTLAISAGDVHPPLYALLINLLFRFTGCDLFYARLAGFLFFVICAAYFCARLGRWVGGISVVFLACSPFILNYAVEARSYGLILGLTLLAMACWDSKNHSRWVAGLMFCVLAALLHYIAALVVLIYLAYSFWIHRAMAGKRRIWMAVGSLGFVLCYDVYFVLRSPPRVNGGFWIQSPSALDILDFFTLLSGTEFNESLVFAFILGGVVAAIKGNRSSETILFGLAVAVFVPVSLFVASYVQPLFVPRYIAFVAPVLFFSTAHALLMWVTRFPHHGMIFVCFVVTSMSISNLIVSYEKSAENVRTLEWEAAAKNSECASELCGFVFDDPVLPAFTDGQYQAIASVFFKRGVDSPATNHWIAIRPDGLKAWTEAHPSTPFVYVKSSLAQLKLAEFTPAAPLLCKQVATSKALVCQRKAPEGI